MVVDNIERLLDYGPIGPRYSNLTLQVIFSFFFSSAHILLSFLGSPCVAEEGSAKREEIAGYLHHQQT